MTMEITHMNLFPGRRGVRQGGDHPRVRLHWSDYSLLDNVRSVGSL
jgi:hypothetical protein